MIAILSPAKTLDFETPIPSFGAKSEAMHDGVKLAPHSFSSVPRCLDNAQVITRTLRSISSEELQEVLGVSSKIAELNWERYQRWSANKKSEFCRQAIFAYRGDVYEGINAYELDKSTLKYLNKHVRILSGLYGLLRPFDLIEPYRLEMSTKIRIGKKPDLHRYWKDSITTLLGDDLAEEVYPVLINLASNEYFLAIDKNRLNVPIVSPSFKEARGGTFKIVSFFAKRARGLMARYISENRVDRSDGLLDFDLEGYRFNKKLSVPDGPVFTRASS